MKIVSRWNKMRTEQNLINHELIGLNAEIISSSNSEMVGKMGRIVDETKNMLTFEKNNSEFSVQKSNSVFKFILDSGEVELHGKDLVGRPEERLKRTLKVKKA